MSDLQWAEAMAPQFAQRLQLDGQAMAVPARHVVDLSAPQHLKAVPDVFQDLGQGRDTDIGGCLVAGELGCNSTDVCYNNNNN